MRSYLFVIAGLMAACAHTKPAVDSSSQSFDLENPKNPKKTVSSVFIRVDEPAISYGETITPKEKGAFLNTLKEEILKIDQALHSSSDLVFRGTAQRVAKTICQGLLPQGAPPADFVDFALRAHGSIYPPPHIIIVDVPKGAEEQSLMLYRKRLKGILKRRNYHSFGLAKCYPRLTPKRRRVVLTLFEYQVQIIPIAKRIRVGSRASFCLKDFKGDRSVLKFVVANSRGETKNYRLLKKEGLLCRRFRCEFAGKMQIELMSKGQYGPEVLANFPIYCGVSPEESYAIRSSETISSDVNAIEKEIFRLTNEMRRSKGLAPLRFNNALSSIARKHSVDMSTNDFVGHHSPRSGNPAQRVEGAGLHYRIVRENVARAYSAKEAVDQLAKSPAHLASMLSKDTTDLGVGVVVDRSSKHAPVLLVTQLFASFAQKLSFESAQKKAIEIVQNKRKAKLLPSLRWNQSLADAANDYLRRRKQDGEVSADRFLSQRLRALKLRYRSVRGVMLKLSSIEALERSSDFDDIHLKAAGLSLRLSNDTNGRQSVRLFILLAK